MQKDIAKTELAEVKETFGDERRSEISYSDGEISIEDTQLQFDNSLFFNINKTSKIKILRDVVVLLHLLVRKIKKLKFGHVLQKSVMKK